MGCNTMESTSGSAMSKSTAMADKSLYDRLGGKPAITAVVDDFVGRVAADSRINGKFANTDIPRLKMLLVEQICQASGGPCTYTGRSMKATHAGMGVSSAILMRWSAISLRRSTSSRSQSARKANCSARWVQ